MYASGLPARTAGNFVYRALYVHGPSAAASYIQNVCARMHPNDPMMRRSRRGWVGEPHTPTFTPIGSHTIDVCYPLDRTTDSSRHPTTMVQTARGIRRSRHLTTTVQTARGIRRPRYTGRTARMVPPGDGSPGQVRRPGPICRQTRPKSHLSPREAQVPPVAKRDPANSGAKPFKTKCDVSPHHEQSEVTDAAPCAPCAQCAAPHGSDRKRRARSWSSTAAPYCGCVAQLRTASVRKYPTDTTTRQGAAPRPAPRPFRALPAKGQYRTTSIRK